TLFLQCSGGPCAGNLKSLSHSETLEKAYPLLAVSPAHTIPFGHFNKRALSDGPKFRRDAPSGLDQLRYLLSASCRPRSAEIGSRGPAPLAALGRNMERHLAEFRRLRSAL